MKNVFLRVGIFCGLFAIQCSVTVLGSVTRDTLFLRVYDSRYISHMVLLMSFATAYASTAIAQLQQRGIQSSTIACAFPLISSLILVVFWIVLSRMSNLLYIFSILFYMWIEISVQLLAQQFWDVCAGAFSVSESKQYFGTITFGSTIGTLLASFGLIPFMSRYDVTTEGTLVIVAGLQALIGIFMRLITPLFQATKKSTPISMKSSTPSPSVTSEIQNRSYLKHVCFFEFGATVVRVFVDYSTLSILGQYPEDTVKYALGSINGAQSFLMIPLQLISGPLFTYFGVMYGISTLPLAVVVFGCSTYLSSSYLLLIASRAMYNSVTYAIFNPARELLWLPLHAEDKTRFKTFVTGPFRSLARVLGALLSMVLTSDLSMYYFGSSAVSVFVIFLGTAWFIDALIARQAYAAEFYASLKKGHMDVPSHLIDFTTDQIELVQKTLKRSEPSRIAFILSFIKPSHVPMFHRELRDVFYQNNAAMLSMPTKLKLIQLHVAYKKEKLHDPSVCIFRFEDMMDLYCDLNSPRQLRLAALLACGYESSTSLEKLEEFMNSEKDVSLVVGGAIAVLRSSQWMHENSTILLQRMLHEPHDIHAKVVCLRIVGKELPELLGNGYLVYLLHESQESRIVHAALECCCQSKRSSPILIPALIKWLADASYRAEALDALVSFPPSLVWDNVVDFLEKGLEAYNFEAILGGIRLLEMGQFPSDAKLDFVLNMMDSLMDSEGFASEPEEMTLCHVLVLTQRLPMWELLVDAIIRATSENQLDSDKAMLNRLDRIVPAFIFRGYQLNYLRKLIDGQMHHALLPQVLECTLDILLRVVLKLVSAKFPKGFNIHVLIEGLHSDVPEVLSAVQEVLETLLKSKVKHTLMPLLFPNASHSPAAIQIEKDVHGLQTLTSTQLIENAMMETGVDSELSCLAIEHYLGLVADDLIEAMIVLPSNQAQKLIEHPLTKEIIIRTLADPHSERALALKNLFKLVKIPADIISTATKVPLSTFEVVTSLRSCALFRSINVIEIVQQIASKFTQTVVTENSTIVAEGELASHMYIIARGSVQLGQMNGAVLATLQQGACFGELALLTSQGTHLASATANTDCVLLGISKASLNTLIQSSPAIARGVLDALASSLKWSYYHGNSNTTNVESHRLKRLVSQVSVTSNVDRAATALLSTIGRSRNRSKSEVPLKETHKTLPKETLVRSQSKSHLRDYSSLQLNSQDFTSREMNDVKYTPLEKCFHLKASHFMKEMDDELIAIVAQMAQVVVLAHREELFQDGSPATNFYVLVEGSITCTTSNGEDDVQKETFGVGDIFGELSFSRGSTHISTATAETEYLSVVLLEIPTTEFIELAEKHIKLLHLVLAWLSRKLTSKMNLSQDFLLPLTVAQPLSPIGSPRNSPQHSNPPRTMWPEDEDTTWPAPSLRYRQTQFK